MREEGGKYIPFFRGEGRSIDDASPV